MTARGREGHTIAQWTTRVFPRLRRGKSSFGCNLKERQRILRFWSIPRVFSCFAWFIVICTLKCSEKVFRQAGIVWFSIATLHITQERSLEGTVQHVPPGILSHDPKRRLHSTTLMCPLGYSRLPIAPRRKTAPGRKRPSFFV